MKLIDILAKELLDWSWNTKVVGQARNGVLHLNHSSEPNKGFSAGSYTLADDWLTAHVTRDEWEAARNNK